MKNKGIFRLFLIIIFTFLLSSCDLESALGGSGLPDKGDFPTGGGEVVEPSKDKPSYPHTKITIDGNVMRFNFDVNYDNNFGKMLFTLPYEEDSFDLNRIKFLPDGSFTAVDKDGKDLGTLLKTPDYVNNYNLNFIINGEVAFKFDLEIQRLRENDIPEFGIKKIDATNVVKEYEYGVNRLSGTIDIILDSGRVIKNIDVTEASYGGINFYKYGEYTTTINLNGAQSDPFTITIKAPKPVEPDPEDFVIKEIRLNYRFVRYEKFGSREATVFFETPVIENITITEDMIVGYDSSKAGTFSFDVKTKWGTHPIEITFLELNNVYLSLNDGNTNFTYGDVKLEGRVIGSYNGKEIFNVPFDDSMIVKLDPYKLGFQDVEIKYLDYTFKLNIVIHPVKEIYAKPLENNYYFLFEEYRPTKVEVGMPDGTVETVLVTKDMVRGFSTEHYRSLTLKFDYKNQEYSFDVEVYQASLIFKDLQLDFKLNEEFREFDIELRASYVYEIEPKILHVTKDMVRGFDTSKTGFSYFYVVYGGSSCRIDILVQ